MAFRLPIPSNARILVVRAFARLGDLLCSGADVAIAAPSLSHGPHYLVSGCPALNGLATDLLTCLMNGYPFQAFPVSLKAGSLPRQRWIFCKGRMGIPMTWYFKFTVIGCTMNTFNKEGREKSGVVGGGATAGGGWFLFAPGAILPRCSLLSALPPAGFGS